MRPFNTILVGGTVVVAQLANASNEVAIALKDLPRIGLNPVVIRDAYRQKANIELNWNDVLKVSANEEGNQINVNTISNIAISVPINAAVGPENKVDNF